MHGGPCELADRHFSGAFENANETANRATRPLALCPDEQVANGYIERPTLRFVGAGLRHQGVEATLSVGVVPGLDGRRGEPNDAPVGLLVDARSSRFKVHLAVAVLEARADKRPEHAKAP